MKTDFDTNIPPEMPEGRGIILFTAVVFAVIAIIESIVAALSFLL